MQWLLSQLLGEFTYISTSANLQIGGDVCLAFGGGVVEELHGALTFECSTDLALDDEALDVVERDGLGDWRCGRLQRR